MLDMTTPWWEIILRVILIYLALLAMIRLSGKREVGQLAPMDLLVILLVSETVSPALTADDTSLPGALLAAGTLFVLTSAIALVTRRSDAAERVVEGEAKPIVRDGHVLEKAMHEERLTEEDLNHALRLHGLTSIADVALAVLEEGGEITVVERGARPGRASMPPVAEDE